MILHFITGGGMTPDQATALGQAIASFDKAHIPDVTFQVNYYKFNDDAYSLIQAAQPTGPLLIGGHSFGGCEAVKTAVKFAVNSRTVDHLMLYDPVDDNGMAYSVPNTAGFALTSNVTEAICFYRNATEAPFSGKIASGPNFKNVLLPPADGGSAAHHGDAVWSAESIQAISAVLHGGYFLPRVTPAPAPAPTPTPTPVPAVNSAPTLLATVKIYSDGTVVKV